MPSLGTYFSDFFSGTAPADDYYIVFGMIGGLLLICWAACCVYFCIDFGQSKDGGPKRRKKKPFGGSDASDASGSSYMEDEALLSADQPVNDQDLLRTFKKVLASGVNMIQHGATGPAVQVHLSLRKNVLYWSGGRPVNGKRELPIGDIMFIDIGKNTAGFVSGQSAKSVDQDVCFSLVTSDQSLDLETTSKMEREAMAQGFSMLMATMESAANV
mmetsp:Transcript_28657/g.33846  ORF Transcript_28657/g.33846 Transcript_28657/m.33846 type:complete len:215 (-) Transcript_28657:49-693(-)